MKRSSSPLPRLSARVSQITRFGLIVTAVAIIVAGLGRASSACPRRSGGPLERIVLAAEPVPPSAPVWLAEQNGYFRQEGVEVEIREFESGRTALFTMVEQGGCSTRIRNSKTAAPTSGLRA